LVSNSTQQPKYFKNIFIFSGQPEGAFGPIRDAARPFPLPIPRWPNKASAFLIDPASPCDVAHLAQLAHISFVFHLRSASYRRRSASRCHARSPLATSGNRVTTMPPPLPLLQLMPPRLSSFRNRSFEVPPMDAIPLRIPVAPLPSVAL
jgi:hypothetical protein